MEPIEFSDHPLIVNTIAAVAEKMDKPFEEVMTMLLEFSKNILNETQNIDAAFYFLMSGIRLADYSDEALEIISKVKLSTQAAFMKEILDKNPEFLDHPNKLIVIPEPETEEEALAITAQVSQFLMKPFLTKV